LNETMKEWSSSYRRSVGALVELSGAEQMPAKHIWKWSAHAAERR
jgi:hypothetical protein